jgi:hypothetical protein
LAGELAELAAQQVSPQGEWSHIHGFVHPTKTIIAVTSSGKWRCSPTCYLAWCKEFMVAPVLPILGWTPRGRLASAAVAPWRLPLLSLHRRPDPPSVFARAASLIE